ncbi:permease prefix domain 1-containing protein [Microbacterium pumilum]|uniref:Permease prefix domain 1-containing protein n=1 Tax=Microbacterium pumilum TaxID=344165 RepID=A0ABP5EIX3_9MICO
MNAHSMTLTERYVAAAMRTVPERSRDDLAAELRASIDDQIDARVEAGEAQLDAERAVLTELGDPDALAAGYTDRPLYLIGPGLYLVWWRLLKLLLCIVWPIAVAAVLLGQLIAGDDIGQIAGTTATTAIAIPVYMGFWVTLVFAILERSSSARANAELVPWNVDNLPEPRPLGVGVADLVVSLILLAAAAIAVVWDQLVGFVRVDGEPLPILNPGLWPWWIVALIALIVAEMIFAIVLFRTRRWTKGLAIANAVLALTGAIPALYLLSRNALLNEAFFTTVIPANSSAEVYSIVTILTGFGIVVIAGWDIVDGILKTWRMSRSAASGAVQAF